MMEHFQLFPIIILDYFNIFILIIVHINQKLFHIIIGINCFIQNPILDMFTYIFHNLYVATNIISSFLSFLKNKYNIFAFLNQLP